MASPYVISKMMRPYGWAVYRDWGKPGPVLLCEIFSTRSKARAYIKSTLAKWPK